MAVRIVTDSTSDISSEVAGQMGITIVPVTVFFGDEALLDGVDISPAAFFERLRTSPVLPRTSQPSVAQFAEAYDGADDIVSVHVSAKLSGTVNAASIAAAEAKNRVEVIDAGGASKWTAMVAIAAAKAAREGKPLEEVASTAREVAEQMDLYCLLDTLEYLQKGGRIGKAQALVGGLLSIKPVLRVVEGEIHPFEKVRSRAKALVRLREIAREGGPYQEVGVLHSEAQEEAEALASDLADLTPGTSITVDILGAAIGVYSGPGAIAIVLRKG